MNRNLAIFSTLGLVAMTLLGLKMFVEGTHGILYVIFPGALMLFSFYALYSRR